jgi:2-polyprenyl-3-methyl-5-hydroxy-6-metoxy-1,4-benzoquinol methylase
MPTTTTHTDDNDAATLAISAEQARDCWDAAADFWEHFLENGIDSYRTALHGPALLEHCGDVAHRDVLDLGCGQGWFSRQLATKGARVTGIDWSPRLIEHARRHEQEAPLQIDYRVLDAAQIGEPFAPASFDLVTGCMSLMDMPSPGAVLAAARPLLRPGGRVVFSVPNPVTDSPHRVWRRDEHGHKLALELDRYFEASSRIMTWSVPRMPERFRNVRTVQYRLTLEQWSRHIEDAGLCIRSLREPRPTAEALARHPDLADAARVPYFLSFELVRAA